MTGDRSTERWVRLSDLLPGQAAIVRRFEGGRGIAHRLASIGLLPGTPVRMRRCIGPVILESRGNRILLGRGIVNHVWVEPCAEKTGGAGAPDGPTVSEAGREEVKLA